VKGQIRINVEGKNRPKFEKEERVQDLLRKGGRGPTKKQRHPRDRHQEEAPETLRVGSLPCGTSKRKQTGKKKRLRQKKSAYGRKKKLIGQKGEGCHRGVSTKRWVTGGTWEKDIKHPAIQTARKKEKAEGCTGKNGQTRGWTTVP